MLIIGVNDFATVYPVLAADWHPNKNELAANQVSYGSARTVWWLGDCGHEWQSAPKLRSRGDGCPICSGRQVLIGFNDLGTKNPAIAAEWHPTKNGDLTAQHVGPGTPKKVWWLGECGHEWDATINSRTGRGWGCPICSGSRVLAGFSDLATVNPALAAEWHPTKNGDLTAQHVKSQSSRKIWWLGGTCGHEWEATISSRYRGKGCPICSGRQVLIGFNDLVTTNPILAAEWHPTKNGDLTAQHVGYGTNKKVWWLGSCKHDWQARIYDRNSFGCPYCAGQKVLIGFNDLATTNPELAAEWHPTLNGKITPQEVSSGTDRKIWWLGKCGHEWDAALSSRRKSGEGCPTCRGFKVLVGFNDLASINPIVAAEWHPTKNGKLMATQVTTGSHTKIWWLGKCGHEWSAAIYTRKVSGCPKCVRQVSKPEERIKELLTRLGLVVEGSNWTMLRPKRSQLDLWIPEKNVAIEFNGNYWHKEKYRGETHHHAKWLACKDKGIQLIQIWEDDWNLRSEIVMRSLIQKLGLSKTESVGGEIEIISITDQQAKKFLDKNHLGGFSSGCYYLGLLDKGDINKLQAVMVLDKEVNNQGKALEIIRYASHHNVDRDFGKLLSYTINAINPASITVVADHCEANEKFYTNNGFIAEEEFPPDYMYVFRAGRKPRSDYSVERFRNDPMLVWEEGLTEMELADLNGLDRIWDAGKTRHRLIVGE